MATMSLGEAIRLGSTLEGFVWTDSTNCGVGKTLEAMGIDRYFRGASYWPKAFSMFWPWTNQVGAVSCPGCEAWAEKYRKLDIQVTALVHLHEDNRVASIIECMSRPHFKDLGFSVDRIADWVDQLEAETKKKGLATATEREEGVSQH